MNIQGRAYWYVDRLIASDLELTELGEFDDDAGMDLTDIVFCAISLNKDVPGSVSWVHQWRSANGQVTAALAHIVDGYLLRFPDLADYRISPDARRVAVSCPETTSIETLRHLLLDQVLPRVLAHAGHLVLHASCVRVQDRVLVFVGETGQGKSSLAASFDAAGYPLLSDDGVVVLPHQDGPRILPTYRSLRLWPDAVQGLFAQTPPLAPMAHYSSKHRVEFAERRTHPQTPLPVVGIFALRSSGRCSNAPQLTPLTPRDGCVELLRHTFQLDVTDPQRTAALFSMVGELARQVPLFAVDYPRDYAYLPDVRAAILDQVTRTGASGKHSFPRRG